MLARLVTEAIESHGPRYVWGDVLPLLSDADLTLVNLECVIAQSGRPFQPERVFYFRATPRALESLKLAGVDYVSMANNHALDYQAPALLETIRRLDGAGIAHAGAGRDAKAAAVPALLRVRGLTIGMVAFADHFRLYAAGPERPGTNVIDVVTDGPDFDRVRRALERLRAAGADVVVFSIHWGPNMRERPTAEFVAFAHAVMDAGADVFHGHSAHVFQGIEVYRGKPILYDTGDLLDDYAVDLRLRNDRQLLYLLEVDRRGVRRLELVPLRIRHARVERARGIEADRIFRRLQRLSGPMGTRLERRGDRFVVPLEPR